MLVFSLILSNIVTCSKMTPGKHGRINDLLYQSDYDVIILCTSMKWGQTATAASSRPHSDSHRDNKKRTVSEGSEEEAGLKLDQKSKAITKSLSQGNNQEPEPAGQIWTKKEREDAAAARLSGGALGAKWRYFSIGTPCDLLLCLSFSCGGREWEKWLWNSMFPVQETSLAFLDIHSGGGPPQICPPADPEPRSIVVSTILSRIYWQ